MFAQDNLAAGETNILLQCRLCAIQSTGGGGGGGGTFYISEYGDV